MPGKLEESESWVRIVSTDDEEQMPPPKSGKHLTERDKAVLKRWIEQGAVYQDHWAYLAPVKGAGAGRARPGRCLRAASG